MIQNAHWDLGLVFAHLHQAKKCCPPRHAVEHLQDTLQSVEINTILTVYRAVSKAIYGRVAVSTSGVFQLRQACDFVPEVVAENIQHANVRRG